MGYFFAAIAVVMALMMDVTITAIPDAWTVDDYIKYLEWEKENTK